MKEADLLEKLAAIYELGDRRAAQAAREQAKSLRNERRDAAP
jgi:hypothetical protein